MDNDQYNPTIIVEPGHKRDKFVDYFDKLGINPNWDVYQEAEATLQKYGIYYLENIKTYLCLDPLEKLDTWTKPNIKLSAKQLELYPGEKDNSVANKMCRNLNRCILEVLSKHPKDNKQAAIATWNLFWLWADTNRSLDTYGASDSETRSHIADAIGKYFNVEMDRWGGVQP